MRSLLFATTGEQADAIRQRHVSATALLDAHLAQIARHNPALNAIVTLDEDGARARAKEADHAIARREAWGPLHGVPVTIKDSLETAGMRTTAGHPPLGTYVPAQDAPCVARLRAAGAIILGKTNLPELCIGPQSDNPLFGRASNPWDPSRTPGGSTGGGAAALASGMTSLTIGSDAGGSVRIPAHYCGVFGLKPTEHRVPFTGHIPELPGAPRGLRHLATLGPMARSIDDLELALRLIAGPDGHQWEVPPVPMEPVPRPTLSRLRLAWTDTLGGIPISADTRAALASLATNLAAAGAFVEQRTPDGFDFDAVWDACFRMFDAEISPSSPPDVAAEWTVQRYTHLLMTRDHQIAVVEAFLGSWDAWLLPVSAGPAFSHCPPGSPIPVDGQAEEYWRATAGLTFPFNLTGQPVVAVPLARSADGLPIGLQVVGPRWSEPRLLGIARAVSDLIAPLGPPPGY